MGHDRRQLRADTDPAGLCPRRAGLGHDLDLDHSGDQGKRVRHLGRAVGRWSGRTTPVGAARAGRRRIRPRHRVRGASPSGPSRPGSGRRRRTRDLGGTRHPAASQRSRPPALRARRAELGATSPRRAAAPAKNRASWHVSSQRATKSPRDPTSGAAATARSSPTAMTARVRSPTRFTAAGCSARPRTPRASSHTVKPDPGKYITIYANSEHAWMVVDGKRFDTVALAETG